MTYAKNGAGVVRVVLQRDTAIPSAVGVNNVWIHPVVSEGALSVEAGSTSTSGEDSSRPVRALASSIRHILAGDGAS